MTSLKPRIHPILRQLLTFVLILVKFLVLVVPVLVFMVWFSYKVDISGLFQGELAPREVANMLLNGDTVSNYDQMDERQVLKLYVQNLSEEQVPETLALGSSRVLQLTKEIVGTDSYYNAGLSGAGVMDIMNAFYLFDQADKLPKNLIIEVDPWIFNGTSADDLNRNADHDLFAEFLKNGLHIDSDYTAPDTTARWKALFDPAYFQGNVKYYLKQKNSNTSTNKDGSEIPFHAVTGDFETLDYAIKRPDGSIYYPVEFRTWSYEQVMAETLVQAGTLSAMHGFDEMDPYWTNLFEQFISYVQSKGIRVVFLLTPYHPFIIKHVYNNPQGFAGFFQVEPWLREYAAQHNIPLYGSYHASRVGVQEWLFFDGIHCKGEALRLIFPGITAALQNEQTAYQIDYYTTYNDKYPNLVSEALVGSTADCLVVDEDWFNQASFATGTGIPYSDQIEIPSAS